MIRVNESFDIWVLVFFLIAIKNDHVKVQSSCRNTRS